MIPLFPAAKVSGTSTRNVPLFSNWPFLFLRCGMALSFSPFGKIFKNQQNLSKPALPFSLASFRFFFLPEGRAFVSPFPLDFKILFFDYSLFFFSSVCEPFLLSFLICQPTPLLRKMRSFSRCSYPLVALRLLFPVENLFPDLLFPRYLFPRDAPSESCLAPRPKFCSSSPVSSPPLSRFLQSPLSFIALPHFSPPMDGPRPFFLVGSPGCFSQAFLQAWGHYPPGARPFPGERGGDSSQKIRNKISLFSFFSPQKFFFS